MAYAVATFLSTFLLFTVELIVAKALLPWFGGAPAVWTTCMLFFQVVLLLGYGYACVLDMRVAPAHQARLHTLLLAASVGLLVVQTALWHSPLIPDEPGGWAGTDHPVARVAAMLSIAIGLPFLLLSATSPLLQRWLAIGRPQARDPYRLYALSNAGSLLGLLSYPVLIEPLLPLRWQAFAWAGLYGIFGAACHRCSRPLRGAPTPPEGGRLAAAAGGEPSHAPGSRMPGTVIAAWVLLPACASALLLATTNKLCQEIAVVPFLWVLPLAAYLLLIHHLLRQPAMVRAGPVHRRRCMPDSDRTHHGNARGARPDPGSRDRLYALPGEFLHHLPRRALPASARPSAADSLLSRPGLRRGSGRPVRGAPGAPVLQGLLGVPCDGLVGVGPAGVAVVP